MTKHGTDCSSSPDDIDRFAFDPNQTTALNPNVTILNQLYLGQSNPKNAFSIHSAPGDEIKSEMMKLISFN